MEIEFKKPELEDQELIREYLWKKKTRSCEFTFANMYLWTRSYKVQFAIVADTLVFRYPQGGEGYYFTCPHGKKENLKEALGLLEAWCAERQTEFMLTLVTPEQFAEIEEVCPGKFKIEYDRDAADYVYETEKLISLSGKKYHGKKNHINKFQSLYPDWSYEPITEENVEDCFQMGLDWRRENGCEEDPDKNAEMCVCMNFLRLFKELHLQGGLIRVQGRVVAFTVAEPVCDDTMVVHIEKAYADVQGAYTMINRQFLLHEAADYPYVNREDDAGEPGLRQAKLSYHPAFMVEKGIVTVNGTQSC